MTDRAAVARVVVDVLSSVCPGYLVQAELHDDTRFGEDLGLDSIEIVEVLLGCEERSGTPVGALLEDGPLTFGRLVDHFARP